MRHRAIFFLLVVAVAAAIGLSPVLGFAWGDAGHRITGEVAAASLPPSAPAFMRNAVRQLAYLNPEPDRWKDRAERSIDAALDGATSPDHFIDIEMAPAPVLAASLHAADRYGYLDTLRAAQINGVVMGLLPFRILELTQQLREDFRQWRAAADSMKPWIEARAIDDAGILGHYVADGSNPLHTTIQYNGWKGANPNGYATDTRLHSRFESGYVGANITRADVASRVDTIAQVVQDLRAGIMTYLSKSNAQVERLYQLDKAHPFDATTPTTPENKQFTADRLAAGARMLRDLWWTAWVTSAPTGSVPPRSPR
jgi:hypothetical protein